MIVKIRRDDTDTFTVTCHLPDIFEAFKLASTILENVQDEEVEIAIMNDPKGESDA